MSKIDDGQQHGGGGEAEVEAPVSPELLEGDEEGLEAEVAELREMVAALTEELLVANEMVASVERRHQIEQEVSRAKAVDVETACLLTEAAIAGMDEPDVAVAVRELRSKKPFLFGGSAGAKSGGVSSMSAMVQHGRNEELDSMAGSARVSGDRGELLRYLQARRGC